jgi:hypothetical protein
MNRIYLSKTEKKILRTLNEPENVEDVFGDISKAELSAASLRLEELGFVKAAYEEGGGVCDIRILDKGKAYIIENPTLENPFDEEELKILQKDNLELQKCIRHQESVIRFWKYICAIISIGWLLFFIFLFFKKI